MLRSGATVEGQTQKRIAEGNVRRLHRIDRHVLRGLPQGASARASCRALAPVSCAALRVLASE